MKIASVLVTALLLVSAPSMAMEVRVGGVPVSELEFQGWMRVGTNTLKLETPNGLTYTLTEGDEPLHTRVRELMNNADNSMEEQEEVALLADAISATAAAENVNHCNGVLEFDPQFFYGISDAAVQVTVSWSESMPMIPVTKRIVAFSKAAAPELPTVTDTSNSGWFQAKPYKTVTSYAGIGPTFQPTLTAIGYFIVGHSSPCPSYTFQVTQGAPGVVG